VGGSGQEAIGVDGGVNGAELSLTVTDSNFNSNPTVTVIVTFFYGNERV
jgi:hypothetical protein